MENPMDSLVLLPVATFVAVLQLKVVIATVSLAAFVLSSLAVLMGYVLGWANGAFHVDVDPRVEAVKNVLPGANCGGCGYAGCQEYAEAVEMRTFPTEKESVSVSEDVIHEVEEAFPIEP